MLACSSRRISALAAVTAAHRRSSSACHSSSAVRESSASTCRNVCFQLFLCLPRACLGKIFGVLEYKMAQKRTFPHLRTLRSLLLLGLLRLRLLLGEALLELLQHPELRPRGGEGGAPR